jgi:endonuclease/exonuclease/phosphatase family metal-dependent hydrolase
MKAEDDLKFQIKHTPALSVVIILLETSLCLAAIPVFPAAAGGGTETQSSDKAASAQSGPNVSPEKNAPNAKPGTLRAVTYNVQFLPGLARHTNKRGKPAYRARQIAEKMSAFDIVGLNETFDDEPRKLIHDDIRERWGKECHILFGPDPQDGRFNGGLSLLSRFPFTTTHSVVYRNFSTPAQYGLAADGFAAKGVLHARVILPAPRFTPQRTLDVFVTHFEARDGSLRRKQFDELAEFMSKHTVADREFLLLGDLNTRGNASYRAAPRSTYNQLFGVLRKSLSQHNVVDAWPARYPGKDGGTKDQTKPTGGPRIDYIVLGNPKQHTSEFQVGEIQVNPYLDDSVTALSDHSAVEATIVVSPL